MSANAVRGIAAPETKLSDIDPQYVESRSVLSIRLQEYRQFLQQGGEAAIPCDLKQGELARGETMGGSGDNPTAAGDRRGSWVVEGDTVVHWRDGRACFTRVCARHQFASVTVGERWLLDGWTCELCAAEVGADRGLARYRALHHRLAEGKG